MSKNHEIEPNKSIQKDRVVANKKQTAIRTADLDLEQRRAALRARKNQISENQKEKNEEQSIPKTASPQVKSPEQSAARPAGPKTKSPEQSAARPAGPKTKSPEQSAARPASPKPVTQNQATRRTGSQEIPPAKNTPSPRKKYTAAQKRRMERERKRRLIRRRIGCFGQILVFVLCLVLGMSAVKSHFAGGKKQQAQVSKNMGDGTVHSDNDTKNDNKNDKENDAKNDNVEAKTEAREAEPEKTTEEIIAEADLLAAGYDYKKAIKLIKTVKDYEKNEEVTKRMDSWEKTRKNLVKFGPGDVTHIFYHTLVVDPKLAFECHPSIATGFKEWMTTVPEFNEITQTMYDNGYVLVSLYDFFEETYDADGTPHFKEKNVYLPKGKKPFILSLDDLSYYHSYTGHGMATKLIIGENGKITCEYTEQDGSTSVGSYDCVPLLNDFMEEHPDGAYRGARGTIALTGYNGVFGYRTDISYVNRNNLDEDKIEWLKDHPEYDYDQEVAEAKKIAEELKAEGWDFASHTWGHIRVGNSSLERIKTDTQKWLNNVKPIIGDTECIIFAHGQDLSSEDDYDIYNNEKYQYLEGQGFHIYLNVDSHRKTMKVHDLYVHGGRRNLDGYRLWSDGHGRTDWTSDLFDASKVLDKRRKDVPTPTD